MKRPREPTPGECCGSGCTRCVWDIYYDELARFEDFMANGGAEEEDSTSSEEDEPMNYIGSVVVKYMPLPHGSAALPTAQAAWEAEEMLERGFLPIKRITSAQSSTCSFSPRSPGISVLDVHADYPALDALPGDVVEILVPNSRGTGYADDVVRLCSALGIDPETRCELHRSPFVPEEHFPPWLPLEVPLTVGQLLALYVDISSSSYLLHRSFFEGLLRIHKNNCKSGTCTLSTAEDLERARLLEVCASTDAGPAVLRALSNSSSPLCYPSLVDALEAFAFVRVPLDRLLELSGPLQPRKFSVASFNPDKGVTAPVQLCMREVCHPRARSSTTSNTVPADALRMAEIFNAVARKTGLEHSDYFFGHTSHPLCAAARADKLRGPAAARQMYISLSLYGSSSFAQHLQAACTAACSPGHAKRPRDLLLLVGCGTGIAPLIAAVLQLMHRRASSLRDEPPFSCWVFYGARTAAELVYDETFKAALAAGAIAQYEHSLSREDDGKRGGVHVTNLLEKHKAAIAEALSGAGQMFVCGPANALRSVRKLLQVDTLAEPDDDDSVQEQRVLLLEDQGRLNFDIWSTGSIFE